MDMYITIRTNRVGSDVELPLGYTADDWNQMSWGEQTDAMSAVITENIQYAIHAK
ncbi:DUF7167 family protein [Xenorhabdus hominickii]|uniref:DUF7167 domain-containing protein n=1 Tax=Xenorhabdus hominickii TaxID=351679 RepID=A0A2G0QBC9_XENHO|nr:hypothetical protein [Xenorhabdus hominickii]PHM53281.1 hypothetical protein Xhom_04176 [Xenorhabdus hominickii]PHM56516.1 hypothetical protein Xhom_02009 [Xenorhabdus hominickii]